MMNHIDRKTCRWLVVDFLSRTCLSACVVFAFAVVDVSRLAAVESAAHERLLIDDEWRFIKDDPPDNSASLLYDVRPVRGAAPARLPTARPMKLRRKLSKLGFFLPETRFSKTSRGAKRPDGNLGEGVAYIAPSSTIIPGAR